MDSWRPEHRCFMPADHRWQRRIPSVGLDLSGMIPIRRRPAVAIAAPWNRDKQARAPLPLRKALDRVTRRATLGRTGLLAD
jgi:hypothetical protein